jgi:hypothetical protein
MPNLKSCMYHLDVEPRGSTFISKNKKKVTERTEYTKLIIFLKCLAYCHRGG